MSNERGISDQERLSDPSDRASSLEHEYIADGIRTSQRLSQQTQEPDEQGNYTITDCVGCGNEIHPDRLRLAAKNTLCIVCATRAERLSRRY